MCAVNSHCCIWWSQKHCRHQWIKRVI